MKEHSTDSLLEEATYPNVHVQDCESILNHYKLEYKSAGYYLFIGEDKPKGQGWMLHLSVIISQLTTLLEIILPELAKRKISFKIARDKETAKFIINGNLGYENLGKIICIYPSTDSEAFELSKILIQLTISLRGPAIPTDFYLGGLVYTRFGYFTSPQKSNYVSTKNPSLIQNELQKRDTISFPLSSEIIWPFNEISKPIRPTQKKLLNNLYKPITVLKPDAKGRVIKGIYFKGIFNIKSCIIKEGKSNMWADEWGRDIQDRLQWQYDLYKNLKGDVPTPTIFDLFKENGDLYLVMEFIKSESLETKLISIYEGFNWLHLSLKNKLSVINYLLNIIKLIEKLHDKGFIHRDITPSNFLINRKEEIFLIDLELAYSYQNKTPNPAFKLGTWGYMSPEQANFQTPTIKDDIFGLGALMTFLFTGLPPVKFNIYSKPHLNDSIFFFTGNSFLANTIINCLNINPTDRPSLKLVKENILTFRQTLSSNKSKFQLQINQEQTVNQHVNSLIINAIKGLTSPQVLTKDQLWVSFNGKKDNIIGNEQVGSSYCCGFHTGLAGILYLLACAKTFGYNIDVCKESYFKSWEYLKLVYLDQLDNIGSGLYNGAAGIALALQEGLDSGLLPIDTESLEYLKKLFEISSKDLNLANGIAGQGTALLKCSSNIEINIKSQILDNYLYILLKYFQKDGSWNIYEKSTQIKTSLSLGISGIISFIISYYSEYRKKDLSIVIKKSLQWLSKQIYKTNKSGNKWGYSLGNPGIAIPFIKGYKLFKDSTYKTIAEKILREIPSSPIYADFSQAQGLSGLGEVYLEAYHAFNNDEWKVRAAAIAEIMEHTFIETENDGIYWSMNSYPSIVADFMSGNSGIIHFLMRYEMGSKISHPLF